MRHISLLQLLLRANPTNKPTEMTDEEINMSKCDRRISQLKTSNFAGAPTWKIQHEIHKILLTNFLFMRFSSLRMTVPVNKKN